MKEIALLEWRVFPLLRNSRKRKLAIYKWHCEDPELFGELIQLQYKRDDGSAGSEDLTDERRSDLATASFNLLNSWKGFPGSNSGEFDETLFKDWIKKAIELCKSKGQERVCGIEIGTMLARSPVGPNGEWPHGVVADFLENQSWDEVKTNFRTGVYNNRGVVTKNLGEGGRQERELSEHFREKADYFKTTHPGVYRMLCKLSEGYQGDALRADVDSEEFED